jgi:Holliday junction resolvase RusA-like endonuclease
MKIHLDIVPPRITAQEKGARIVRPKVGKPFISHYVKHEVREIEELFLKHLLPQRPPQPLSGPLRMVSSWIFPYRASEPKRRTQGGQLLWHDKRPDTGNIQKLLTDCIVKAGFMHDDGQVADDRVTKHWGQHAGIWIEIYPL